MQAEDANTRGAEFGSASATRASAADMSERMALLQRENNLLTAQAGEFEGEIDRLHSLHDAASRRDVAAALELEDLASELKARDEELDSLREGCANFNASSIFVCCTRW